MENSQTHRAPLPPARSATKFIIGSARQPPQTFTAFRGERLLASGTKLEVALSVKAALQTNGAQTILIFEDGTGRQVDFDLRGEDHEIAACRPCHQMRCGHADRVQVSSVPSPAPMS